jgi:1,4-alpha-glucan branching enzyme
MNVAFLYIAHAPYLRRAGRLPTGEDELHELIAFSLLPFVSLLEELRDLRLPVRMALACSPLLLEQLGDPIVQKHFMLWMEAWVIRRRDLLARCERSGDEHGAYLARFDLEWAEGVLYRFEERFGRDLLAVLRELCADGILEPLACTASNAYLPLLQRPESVAAQIEHGALYITRTLGRPQGLWLPGCGWRPGLESSIEEIGLRYVVLSHPGAADADFVCRARLGSGRLNGLFCDDELAAYVWSAQLGYRGDPIYRRMGSPDGPYDPYHAFRRAQEHANHFVTTLVARAAALPRREFVLLPLDAALLGRYWFEGPNWLQAVLTRIATLPGPGLQVPAELLRRRRASGPLQPPADSWAVDGTHAAWQGPAARPYWEALHQAEERLVRLARRDQAVRGDRERLLNQAARELLLAQDSEWSLRLTTGAAPRQVTRWRAHIQRCHQLCALAERSHIDADALVLLERLEEFDGPFANLNYRVFAAASR